MYTAVHQSNSGVVDELRRDFIGCLWLVCVIVGSLWCNDEAGGLISHTIQLSKLPSEICTNCLKQVTATTG